MSFSMSTICFILALWIHHPRLILFSSPGRIHMRRSRTPHLHHARLALLLNRLSRRLFPSRRLFNSPMRLSLFSPIRPTLLTPGPLAVRHRNLALPLPARLITRPHLPLIR
ncbi:hypothetical protein KC19_VG196600 [Ceratodon purpureus]|uniref:Secreted protein n=1 Tax=Ceratodon purpureus TaxID=3225 RepID=A0A8T0HS26_CERPU|nr:hypothetical protein KC19_VG196600 [Ceratodon purpureus]